MASRTRRKLHRDLRLAGAGLWLSTPVSGDLTRRKRLNELLKKMVGHLERRALNQLALRSMMQAVYSAEESGRTTGWARPTTCHFTSPIRRYPDLLGPSAPQGALGNSARSPQPQQRDDAGRRGSSAMSRAELRAGARRDAGRARGCVVLHRPARGEDRGGRGPSTRW